MSGNSVRDIPVIINQVNSTSQLGDVLEVASRNKGKLEEFERILKEYKIEGKDLKTDEVQSLNAIEVAEKKAIEAWRKNEFNPIIVEDTSLEIMGLGGRPGPYVDAFTSEVEMRRIISKTWLKGKDRRAVAIVTIAYYDGVEVQYRQGRVGGVIAEKPRGTNGFGFDDIFIPDGQKTKAKRTFAEMTPEEKDTYSMRKKALIAMKEKPFNTKMPVFMLDEPYAQEVKRINKKALSDKKALKFAYSLEAIENSNKPNSDFEANKYDPISKTSNDFFDRYTSNPDSKSLGLIFTDVDKSKLKITKNELPILWQMGPTRRTLALACRAEFFLKNHNTDIYSTLDNLDKQKASFPKRCNRIQPAVESALGLSRSSHITGTHSLKELGYKKLSSTKEVSRSKIALTGLFNIIGKYPRSYFAVGSMPAVSGWRDVLTTSALANMAVFTHRNSLHAGDIDKQIALIKSARIALKGLGLSKNALERANRNIGAAVGTANPVKEMKNVEKLYDEADVKLFRIYTINSDPRIIEIATKIRKKFGDEVEIFVGQVVDKTQAFKLVSDEIQADALIFGHGGGRQCTSAVNGMAVTTLEEVYKLTTDAMFNDTSILIEGGVGYSVGPLMLLGIDGILYNQQLTKATIETGDFVFEHKNGKFAHPYHGSASAPTMIIEVSNQSSNSTKLSLSGRANKVEGKPGYTFYEKKANTMCFYIDQFRHFAARTLADLGVESIWEMREFLAKTDKQLLRTVSNEAAIIASPYRNS